METGVRQPRNAGLMSSHNSIFAAPSGAPILTHSQVEGQMPALEITRTMLVNQGLSAASASANLAVLEPETQTIVPGDKSLDAFKKFVVQDSLLVDQNFSSVIAGFTTPLDLATWLI